MRKPVLNQRRRTQTENGSPSPHPKSDQPEYREVTEENGFTLSLEQHRAGIRLAISPTDGLIERCAVCGKRTMVTIPRNGERVLVCAEAPFSIIHQSDTSAELEYPM